jgi:pheromone shutdown-related protein TraB
MDIVLIGTAHVSRKSVEEVEKVIEEEKPQAVAVELCYRRFITLTQKKPQEISVVDVIKKGDAPLLLLQMLLSYFQRKIGEEYGVKPGEEMLTAINKAREIGADVLLIDRDIAVTFKRFWNTLSPLEKLKFVFYLLKSFYGGDDIDVDEMLKEDILERLIKDFRKISPSAAKVLIDERDAYMAYRLLQASKKYEKIVAVVGAGHKKGIEKYLKNPELLPDIRELEEVRERRFSLLKLASYAIFGFVILTFLAVLTTMNSEIILKAFLYWFLINGVLASLGALIAGAHPLSALGAFLSAWLTSLNPMIAAGWVSGLIEAKIRKPSTKDLEDLTSAESLRELMRNKIFRILLVAALTNVGSMIGTIYGAYYIMQTTGVDIPGVIKENLAKIFRLLI